MTLSQKIEAARVALRQACEDLCAGPNESEYWRDVCSAKARLVALLNCAGRI
jgi:hypothetical protein